MTDDLIEKGAAASLVTPKLLAVGGALARRFTAKYVVEFDRVHPTLHSPCWNWFAARSDGYGTYCVAGVMVKAHRHAYEALRGPVPAGLELDHLCRNRACVNPDHLEPVSKRENVLRGEGPTAINARKTHCAKAGHPLTDDNVRIQRGTNSRTCIACAKERSRAWYLGHRGSGAAAPALT